MPWLGLKDTEKVVPEEIEDGETVFCPDCGREMFPRGPFDDGRARHFTHKSSSLGGSGGNCSYSVGESETHKKWKSQVLSAMKQRFEGIESAVLEVDIDVSDTLSLNDTRRADVLVTFEDESMIFGDGIAIEVQYKNDDKDLDVVTNDYLSKNYSVFWASSDHFTTDRFLLDKFDDAFEPDEQIGFCPYHDDVDNEFYLEILSDEFFDGKWTSHIDPLWFCDHEFYEGECLRCEIDHIEHPTTGESIYSGDLPDTFTTKYDDDNHPVPFFKDCNHSWVGSNESSTSKCEKCLIEVRGQGAKCNVRLEHSKYNAADFCGFSWYLMHGKIVCQICGKEYESDDESFPDGVV